MIVPDIYGGMHLFSFPSASLPQIVPHDVLDDVEIHTPGAPPDPVHFPFTTDAFTVARVESRAANAATRGSFIATWMIELLGDYGL
ncbi:hypothetical protein FRB91_006857 [Serendipita sp. 411]|nr:hypothetical protein FRB91_006857 [Serendipita sp. 411]